MRAIYARTCTRPSGYHTKRRTLENATVKPELRTSRHPSTLPILSPPPYLTSVVSLAATISRLPPLALANAPFRACSASLGRARLVRFAAESLPTLSFSLPLLSSRSRAFILAPFAPAGMALPAVVPLYLTVRRGYDDDDDDDALRQSGVVASWCMTS